MTNIEMARSYLLTAEYSLRQARAAHADGVWHLVVRRCQEGVEMALKASLGSGVCVRTDQTFV